MLFEYTLREIKKITSALCLLSSSQFIDQLEDHEILPLKMAIIKTNKPYNTIQINELQKAQDKIIKWLTSLINDCTTPPTGVTHFSLLGANIGDETTIALAAELKKNKSLTKLTFGGAGVSNEGLQPLAEAIKHHPNLQELYITVGQTSPKALIHFVMTIVQNTNIVTFSKIPFLTSVIKSNSFSNFFNRLKGKDDQSFIKFLNNLFSELAMRNNDLKQYTKNSPEYISRYNQFAQEWNERWQTGKELFFKTNNLLLSDILIRQLPGISLKSKCLFFINANQNHPTIKKSLQETILPEELKQELATAQVRLKI